MRFPAPRGTTCETAALIDAGSPQRMAIVARFSGMEFHPGRGGFFTARATNASSIGTT